MKRKVKHPGERLSDGGWHKVSRKGGSVRAGMAREDKELSGFEGDVRR